MLCDQRSGDDYTLKRRLLRFTTSETKCDSSLALTDDEVKLLLRITNEYKVAKSAENVDWDSVFQTIQTEAIFKN